MAETDTITMTPDQARAACDTSMHGMAITRWLTMKMLVDLSPQQWMHQVAPGTNHPMFNFGHIVVCDGNFLAAAGGASSVPAAYSELFNGGIQPEAGAARYPKPAELLEVAERARGELVSHLQALSGDALLAPVNEPRLQDILPTLAHLPGFIAMHEASHTGQIMLVRKALGLPGVLGRP